MKSLQDPMISDPMISVPMIGDSKTSLPLTRERGKGRSSWIPLTPGRFWFDSALARILTNASLKRPLVGVVWTRSSDAKTWGPRHVEWTNPETGGSQWFGRDSFRTRSEL